MLIFSAGTARGFVRWRASDPDPGLTWLSGAPVGLGKLALADDRLVIDQFLVDQHSHIFSGVLRVGPMGLPRYCEGALNAGQACIDLLLRLIGSCYIQINILQAKPEKVRPFACKPYKNSANSTGSTFARFRMLFNVPILSSS